MRRGKDSDARYTEEGILATLSTLNVIEYGGQRGLSEVTKNVRRILKLFDFDVPKGPMYHAAIFDMAAYVEKSTLGQEA